MITNNIFLRRNLILLFSIIFFISGCSNKPNIDLCDGDIIFQTSKSKQSEALELATHSKITHMGIIFLKNNESIVLEAVQPVKLTKLNDWIKRGDGGKYTVKRLTNADSLLTPAILNDMRTYGLSFLGKNYDKFFEWTDDRMYCSELVYKIYKHSLNIEIGSLQRLQDFDLSDPIVKQLMQERYGNNFPYDEIVISPISMFNSGLLKTIYSNQ